MHDMELGFEFAADHPERTGHAFLSVDVVMLVDGMQEDIARGNTDIERALLDLLDVLLFDFVAIIGDRNTAAIIQAFEVRTGDRSHHPGNLAIGLLLRFGDRLVETKGDFSDVDDLAFANTARKRFAGADDAQEPVAARLGNDRRNLGGSDFQANMKVGAGHGGVSVFWLWSEPGPVLPAGLRPQKSPVYCAWA